MAKSVESVYDTVIGDALMHGTNYPSIIVKFLAAEKEIVAYVLESFSGLVEFDFHSGIYARLASVSGMRYIGVNNSAKYVELARKRFNEGTQISFVCENTDTALDSSLWKDINKPLLFFPFNSFGRIYTDLEKAKAVFSHNIPFLVSLFKTNDIAASAQLSYYEESGLKNVEITETDHAISMYIDGNILSATFTRSAMVHLARSAGFRLTVFDMSEVGACYFFDPASF